MLAAAARPIILLLGNNPTFIKIEDWMAKYRRELRVGRAVVVVAMEQLIIL
jgi:hypothetical protein